MRNLSSRKIGILQILLSGFCFGFLGIFGKAAYSRGLTPGEFLSLRYLIGAVMLFVALTIWRRSALQMSWRRALICLSLGVFGYAVFSSCYFVALQGLSASLTVLLL